MKRFFKRAISLGLIVAMVATLLPSSFGWPLTAKAAESDVVVSDLVQVQIGETVTDMQLYRNGVYEAACNLTAGAYEAKLLVNGEVVGDADAVTVSADQTVYFRYQDGTLKDSINAGDLVHSAALVGNFNGIEFLSDAADATSRYDIASWNPADANAELAYIGGGLYERTFYFKELSADVDLADGGYKVAFDDTWGYSFGNGDSNIALTVPAGSTSITILCDEINKVVYDSIRTPDFVIKQNSGDLTANAFRTSVSLIGTARCDEAANWTASATGYEFSQISDTLFRYQKVFAAGSYDYKCVFNYANWYEAEGSNRNLSVSEDNTNVVFLYDTTTGLLKDSLNNADEVAQMLGMAAAPEAPAEAKVEDLANGKTRFTMPVAQGSSVELYYAAKAEVEKDGTSAFKKLAINKTKTEEETGNDVYQTDALFLGDNAIDAVYYYMVDGKKVLDSSKDQVSVAGESYSSYVREKFTGRLVNVPGTFPGPSWDANSNKMTYAGNGIYQYTFQDVPAANYQFKISFGSWTENYGVAGKQDGDNYSLTVADKQDVTVYYSDFSHLAVTSIDYIFADISLLGTGIPENTKLTDEGLTGIYSVTVPMKKGTYEDLKLHDNDENVSYEFGTVKVDEDKDVTFYYDPSSEVFYCDASNEPIEEENIYYNTKSTEYKSVYGAVATGEDVTFTLQTGTDIKNVRLVVKGVEKKVLPLEKAGDVTDGVQKWSVTTNFSKIGEVNYYFVLSNGSAVKIYSDDDGYYGEGMVTDLTNIKPYDLVIYKDGFETPDWMKNAVIYQIFPERFFDGDISNDFAQTSARGAVDYEYITDWSTLPENPEQEAKLDQDTYESTGAFYGDGNWSNEIYGGDLTGITDKIDYLKALGVNVIYINPVFSSISSHRYDTSDYELIDPILGDLGDFKELVKTAEANDMHIVLDGVFNHVSDDSKYFDRYYKYLEAGTTAVGAYPYWAYVYDEMEAEGIDQTTAEQKAKEYFKTKYGITDFSYTEWFAVSGDSYITDDNKEVVKDEIGLRAGKPVYSYEGWWGYDSMPVIKSTNGSEYQSGNWGEKIIGNDEGTSVTQYWLSEGSNGWRLDVANEVSDETWQKFRESVKALDSDAVIIGEIWDDATEYLLGDMYDSVMNYVFRNAVLSYAKGGSKEDMEKTLEKIRERYPKEAFYAMMNLVGSHDTSRVLSYLDGIDDDRKDTSIGAAFPTYEKTSDLAKQRQYLVAFLQFTYAGAPTIYYGDEIGMVGADDPDDRRAFTWGEGNKELVTWYATLADIRSNYTALRTGDVTVFDAKEESGVTCDNIVSYVRSDDKDSLVVLANNAQEEKTIVVDLNELGINETALTDLISGTTVNAADGKVTVRVPALSGMILTADTKQTTVDEKALAPAYDPAYKISERVVATDVTLEKEKVTLDSGKTESLKAVVTPDNATQGGAVVWSSSNEKVATVDANGVVTAVGAGKATVTATAMYSVNQVSASCDVIVNAKSDDTKKDDDSKKDDDAQKDDDSKKNDDAQKDDDSKKEDDSKNGSEVVNVAITSSAGWAELADKLGTLSNDAVVEVAVSKDADTITSGVLSKLAGTKMVLKVKLENGITWKIDGSKLTAGKTYADIDLGVTKNTSNIPAGLVQAIPDTKATVQISLDYSGEFGYEMTMNLPLGSEYKGLYANLYYYNPQTKKLEFVQAVTIGEDGSADLTFTHASDFVIAISEKNLEHVNVTPAVDTGDHAPMAMLFVVLLGMGCVGAGVYRNKRQKRA